MTRKLGAILITILWISLAFFAETKSADAEEAFCMPTAAPLYGAPPFIYKDNRILSILFKTKPEVLQKLVPQPLIPNTDNLIFVYVGILNVGDPPTFTYKEMGIGIPVALSGTPGNFCPYMYLDKAGPIVGGREIYGFPKKDAEIKFVEEKGQVVAKMVRAGYTLLDVTLQLSKKVEPIQERPSLPWYNLKLIPSIKKNAPPDVKHITSNTLSDRVVKEEYTGNVELKFGGSSYDPLGQIEVTEIVYGSFLVSDFILGYGEVVHDYLR
jgi:acetoacetate decarboxylase